ncbi:DNA-binding domain of Mlu1-box binding protein MBP1 [Auriscalpium vulgare]|uniref:DNA-binding domain of Mlu1-box binding protein MBP1 n=1 Tax=Auriscalpium vulgare TaxID=40419 RepID=A0ACB8S204_9AGAM|nr:DNA-binding domain of Mlu1-box binding protein MBP1 [Auriscalpium vulgare]
MSSGMIQDSLSSSPAEPSSSGPRFRPFASPAHHVTKSRYITSNDPRGYIPVYEYPLNGQWIMMDVDDGYVLWTGIWKALGNSKADIVKMIESQPDLASQIRRVRGGYLKIQGTWMPYEVALRLSRRVAWPIRNELVPLFGPTFPSTCLSPDQPGYGQVVVSSSGRRRSRRATQAVASNAFPAEASEPQAGWTIISAGPVPPHDSDKPLPSISHPSASSYPPVSWSSGLQGQHQRLPPPQLPRLSMSAPDPTAIDGGADRLSTDRGRGPPGRYSPYPGASYASTKSSPAGNPPQSFPESFAMSHPHHFAGRHEQITLPPIQPPSKLRTSDQPSISLPPISSWAGSRSLDSVAILQRLQSSDAGVSSGAIDEDASRRRHSLSLPSRQ